MADQKLTEMSEITSIALDNLLLYGVDATGGPPEFGKISGTNLATSIGFVNGEGARVYRNSAQTIANGAWDSVEFDQESYDTNSIHDNVTNNSRLTCKTAGKYIVVGNVEWDTDTSGFRGVRIFLNNSTVIASQLQPTYAGAGYSTQSVVAVCNLEVDDYVELQVIHDAGHNLDIIVGGETPVFSMQKISSSIATANNEGAGVYSDVDQSLTESQWNTIAFEHEFWDTDNIHDNITNNSRLTCKTSGVYIVTASVGAVGAYTGVNKIQLQFLVDGVANGGGPSTLTAAAGGEYLSLSHSTILDLAENQYVEVQVHPGTQSGIKTYGSWGTQFINFRMQKIYSLAASADSWVSSASMTYASADDPTYTMTCSGDKTGVFQAGQRIKLTQATGGTKYFIITKVAYGAPNTTLTLYGGTDYNLENEAISNPYYSLVKAPFGFPLDPAKWTVEFTDTNQNSQASPSSGTWYNVGSLTFSIPIGAWNVSYKCTALCWGSIARMNVFTSLSSSSNSESDADFTCQSEHYLSGSTSYYELYYHHIPTYKIINVASKTSYYLIAKTSVSSQDGIRIGNQEKTVVRCVCAYL